jgi:hypothetical protein
MVYSRIYAQKKGKRNSRRAGNAAKKRKQEIGVDRKNSQDFSKVRSASCDQLRAIAG